MYACWLRALGLAHRCTYSAENATQYVHTIQNDATVRCACAAGMRTCTHTHTHTLEITTCVEHVELASNERTNFRRPLFAVPQWHITMHTRAHTCTSCTHMHVNSMHAYELCALSVERTNDPGPQRTPQGVVAHCSASTYSTHLHTHACTCTCTCMHTCGTSARMMTTTTTSTIMWTRETCACKRMRCSTAAHMNNNIRQLGDFI